MKNFNVTSMLVMLMFMCITSMQAQSITPSKKYITKELNNVSNFSSIRVLGSPDVEYRQSSDSKTTVSIYGSDNLVDLLEVSTVNGVLQVNIKKGVKILSGERRLKVIASSPSLDDVDIKLRKTLLSGRSVNIKGLGYFFLSAQSKGTEKAENFTVSDISGLRVCFRANSDIRLFTGTSTRSDGLKFKDLDHINDSSIIDGDSGEGGEAPDPDGGAGGNGEAPDPAA